VLIYWFRNDLRLTDNLAFSQACADADCLVPIYVFDSPQDSKTEWGFNRVGGHRQAFLRESLDDLRRQLKKLGSDLYEFHSDIASVIPSLVATLNAKAVYCEQIEAPEEINELGRLRALNINVKQFWQSSMLDLSDLPFEVTAMPDVFTTFRQKIEKSNIRFSKPLPKVTAIPALPSTQINQNLADRKKTESPTKSFTGGETAAHIHINQYFERRLPDTYKLTRNQLIGMDYSSKFSPWLSTGCVSAKSIAARLNHYEYQHGANDGTYWLWFELLWRDYFRFLHFKYGLKLYRKTGLSEQPANSLDPVLFDRWRRGNTDEELIDAGMIELNASGYLSNRLRQVVASYWIHNLKGDWRAGAAWFESRLIDYDVYSNQGNWLYIAGRGTDPRGGRAFNILKQTNDHDADGSYRRRWLTNPDGLLNHSSS